MFEGSQAECSDTDSVASDWIVPEAPTWLNKQNDRIKHEERKESFNQLFSSKGQHRGWAFTTNNYTLEDMECIRTWPDKDEVKRVMVSEEVGDEGTPHLQGCIMFDNAKRFSWVKKWFEQLTCAHLGGARNWRRLVNYCCKPDGEIPADILLAYNCASEQGKRSDLLIFCERMKNETCEEIAEEMKSCFVRYHRGLMALGDLLRRPRSPEHPPNVCWVYGGSGLGKSRMVNEREPDLWISSSRLDFFIGWRYQRAAFFDDFRGSLAKLSWFLRLLDRYPLLVEIKGAHRQWNPDRIYISSPYSPEQCYAGCGEQILQLTRRISTIIHLTPGCDPTFIKGSQDMIEPYVFKTT